MNTVTPVKYTTPAGLEITLRATLGARKRIAERFGSGDISAVFSKFGDGSLPELAFCLAFDAKGKAPAFNVPELAESLTPGDAKDLLAHILSAFSQGKLDPNEAAEVLATLLGESELPTPEAMSTGSISTDSDGTVSA